MIIYIHPRCSTCKEALRFLEDKKISYTAKDITQTPPTVTELQTMLDYQKGDVKKLFNTSGQLYREMELSQKLPKMSQEMALALLHQHGMLVKRPFLLSRDIGLIGFKAVVWGALL